MTPEPWCDVNVGPMTLARMRLALRRSRRQHAAMAKIRSFLRGSIFLGSLAVPVALAAGCSNDRPQLLYTIPVQDAGADTQVNQLDDSQLQTICDSYANYVEADVSFDTVSHALCLVSAQLASFNPETCQAVFDDCIAGAPDPISVRAQIEDGKTCTGTLRNCDATVDQLQGCLNVQLDTVVGLIDSLACAGANDQSRAMASDLNGGVSACANLNGQCTQFADPVTLQ